MWGYSGLLHELSSMYCMDSIDEEALSSQSYCFCSSLSSLNEVAPVEDNRDKQNDHELAKSNDFSWNSKASVFKCVNQKKSHTSLYEKETFSEDSEEYKSGAQMPKKRKRKTKELNIRKKLTTLRSRILSNRVAEFNSSYKKAKSANRKSLKRRSKYIGVSKNNSNWQALINIGQIKKYIGTFSNELQGARAYDLYSVALRGEEGALNFDYSAQDMLERIDYFLKHKSVKFD
ncbi:unnamed protein product [Moneuplotes crassus]|uniref:AP2/ERF domain-containing protein n=1 Tax=Euplotes crassus TaxID=5936 RepID=A0AAD2D4B4_EUPCR|nr:unnamed protein product [Moneuplotes crassus]